MLDIRSYDRPARDVQLDGALLLWVLILGVRREEDGNKSVDLEDNALLLTTIIMMTISIDYDHTDLYPLSGSLALFSE